MAYDLDHCRVCKAPLSDLMREWAHRKIEPMLCGDMECAKKDHKQRYGCCEQAEPTHCVCLASFKCPVHGNTHIGTHD